MSSASSPSITKSAFERLPVEIMQAIMKELPDLLCLDSMIRSCSTFNEALAQAGSLIASHVLTEQIEPHLQPEAIAVFGSSRIKAWNQATFSAFDRRHLQRRNCRRVTWSLEDIKSISRLRRRINYFADDFAAKSKSHMLGGSASVTVAERARFQRAFYMFELFCNVFRDFRRPVLPLPETSTQFFARFSIVENEQLACVRDYLFRAIVPALDDMVEHDVVWGEMSVEYSDWRDPGYIEPLLARGIEGVYSIVTAEGYEESYESMYPRYPETTHNFLNAALNGSNEDYHNVPIWSYASQDINEANAHSFFEETDEGPAEVWLWSHRRSSKRLFVNSDAHRSLQQWGYVMWDLPELNKADVFKSAWRQPPPEQASIERVSRESQLPESAARRAEIYQGGRGWWSFEDEAKSYGQYLNRYQRNHCLETIRI